MLLCFSSFFEKIFQNSFFHVKGVWVEPSNFLWYLLKKILVRLSEHFFEKLFYSWQKLTFPNFIHFLSPTSWAWNLRFRQFCTRGANGNAFGLKVSGWGFESQWGCIFFWQKPKRCFFRKSRPNLTVNTLFAFPIMHTVSYCNFESLKVYSPMNSHCFPWKIWKITFYGVSSCWRNRLKNNFFKTISIKIKKVLGWLI